MLGRLKRCLKHSRSSVFLSLASRVFLPCLVLAIAGHRGARAEGGSNQDLATPLQAEAGLPLFLKSFADETTLRTRLAQEGVQLSFNYYGEVMGNPSGGERQGARYDGRLAAIVEADLNRLVGWPGASFYASFHDLQGSSLSEKNLDSLMTVSNIQEPATARLYYLLIDQQLNAVLSVRVGQFTAAREFLVSDNASLFLNSTFGWMLLPAQDLPAGGPAYPEATPGIRLKFTPSEQFTLLAAVFNGDPASPGTGNPIKRDANGLAFRVNDPPLFIAELGYAYNKAGQAPGQYSSDGSNTVLGLPGSVKLGAWLYTGSVAGLNPAAGGPGGSGAQPIQYSGNFSIYAVIDQALWRTGGPDNDRGLNFFLRAAAAPSDRNLIDRYFDTGLTFKAPIESRPDDSLGLGFAFGRISPAALASDGGSPPLTSAGFEAAIELTYQWQIAKNWTVQPDVQYILHPSGQLVNPPPGGNAPPIPNAAVFALRTVVNF